MELNEKKEAEETNLSPVEARREERRKEKQRQREEQQRKKQALSMITRAEAYSAADRISRENIAEFYDAIKEPLKLGILQVTSLASLLISKGIITKEELEEAYKKELERASADLEENAEGGVSDDQTEETHTAEETEEQPGEGESV